MSDQTTEPEEETPSYIGDCEACGREMEWQLPGEQECSRCGELMYWNGWGDEEDDSAHAGTDFYYYEKLGKAQKDPPNHPTFSFVDSKECDLTAGRYRRIIHWLECDCGARVSWYQGDVPERICYCGQKHRWDDEDLDYSEENNEEKNDD